MNLIASGTYPEGPLPKVHMMIYLVATAIVAGLFLASLVENGQRGTI
jgi:hypothetical protein